MDKKSKTFFGIIGAIISIFILIGNPWDFRSLPTIQFIIGLAILIGSMWAVYDANR